MFEGMGVLLIECYDALRETFGELLEMWGCEVVLAKDSAEALEKIHDLKLSAAVRVAIIDHDIQKGINGIETVRQIRQVMPDIQVLIHAVTWDEAMQDETRSLRVRKIFSKGDIDGIKRELFFIPIGLG